MRSKVLRFIDHAQSEKPKREEMRFGRTRNGDEIRADRVECPQLVRTVPLTPANRGPSSIRALFPRQDGG